jgi:putative ABC transport system permease protein
MRWKLWRAIVNRQSLPAQAGSTDNNLDEELRFHLEQQIAQNIAAGMSPEAARYAALRAFGGVEQIKEECRDARGSRFFEELVQDVRYGLRILARSPGFTAVAVLTLALGIGANTAIFSVVNAVLLRPLPYKDPGRLVQFWSTSARGGGTLVSPADFAQIAQRGQVFESAALFRLRGRILTGAGEPEPIGTTEVAAGVFQVLGVNPVLGRTFLPAEEQPGRNRVAVLSHPLWQQRFGSDPGVLGKTVLLDEKPYTLIGVMPAGFQFPSGLPSEYKRELWEPLVLDANERTNPLVRTFQVIARLKQGAGLKQTQLELNTVAARLAQEFPQTNKGWGFLIEPLLGVVVGEAGKPLLLLLAAVGFVFLIGCTNVANLLLARGLTRQREIAVRESLGASRLRVVRFLLTESLILAVMGGALGLVAARCGVDVLRVVSPGNIPRIDEASIDIRVLGFTVAASLVAAMLFGLVPAFLVSNPDLISSLKEGGMTWQAGFARHSGHRLRGLLVTAEVALSLVLLTASGLMIKSLWRLVNVPRGFSADRVLTAGIILRYQKYRAPAMQRRFFQELLEGVRSLPGVEAAAVSSGTVLRGRWMNVEFDIPGRAKSATGEQNLAEFQAVSPDFFRTLGIRLIRGRFFTERDAPGAPNVVIINEAMARCYWPNEDPLGKQLANILRLEGTADIVGVVGDTRDISLAAEPKPGIYVCYLQAPSSFMDLLVRTVSNPSELAAAVRSQVWAIDKNQPISDVMTLEQALSRSAAETRYHTVLLGSFAGVALLLTLVGLYGVMSYIVAQRTHEIGLRLALGAEPSAILKLVVRQGMVYSLTGVGVGLCGSLALTRFLASILFEVRPIDLPTFALVSLLLAGAALLAAFLPARRATKVDPMVALRYE